MRTVTATTKNCIKKDKIMSLQKLDELLEGTISEMKIELLEEEELLLAKCKQGGDMILYTKEDLINGIVLSTIQKVPASMEGSPRALVITADPEKAFAMFKLAIDLLRRTEVDVEHAHDKGVKIEQRNAIFEGAEIIYGNLRRMFELYIQNGINMNLIQLIILDNTDDMLRDAKIGQLKRIIESLPKCQRIIISEKKSDRINDLVDDLLINGVVKDFLPR